MIELIKRFFYWRKLKKGFYPTNFEQNVCGYPLGLKVGVKKTFKLESGRVGIYRLNEIKYFLDPTDMVDKAYWSFIGYQNKPLFKNCSFFEFINLIK